MPKLIKTRSVAERKCYQILRHLDNTLRDTLIPDMSNDRSVKTRLFLPEAFFLLQLQET